MHKQWYCCILKVFATQYYTSNILLHRVLFCIVIITAVQTVVRQVLILELALSPFSLSGVFFAMSQYYSVCHTIVFVVEASCLDGSHCIPPHERHCIPRRGCQVSRTPGNCGCRCQFCRLGVPPMKPVDTTAVMVCSGGGRRS